MCANSVGYLEAPLLPGGCLMTAALTDYDGRPGRVRDAVAEVWSRWRERLRTHLIAAVDHGELPAGFDIDQALFEIVAAGLALKGPCSASTTGQPRAGPAARSNGLWISPDGAPPPAALAEHAKRAARERVSVGLSTLRTDR